jgi:hypothetical protein
MARLKGSRIAQALTLCLGGVVLEVKTTASSELGALRRTTAELWTAEAMKVHEDQRYRSNRVRRHYRPRICD